MKPVERPAHRATTCPDDGLPIFLSVRPRLFGIAHRMLGNAAEAEDIVQDVWVRWQTTDRSVVRSAVAFLATTTIRLAINVMQSARWRRETYLGPWRTEPVDASAADPGLGVERGEALELAALILMEKLPPAERAAYILREAFDYAYRDIADILRVQEANARQLVSRARQHMANGPRSPADGTESSCRLQLLGNRRPDQYQSLMDIAGRVAHSLAATRVRAHRNGADRSEPLFWFLQVSGTTKLRARTSEQLEV